MRFAGWPSFLFNIEAAPNKRLERTRHERASLLSNLGEPLKRNVRHLHMPNRLSVAFLTLWAGTLPILIVCAPTAAFAEMANPSSLEGSTWEISDSNHQAYIFDFMARSKLRYVAANGTRGRGSWKQTDNTVTFEINGHFVQYKGIRMGDEMHGEAKYRDGGSAEWAAFRQQALVTTPNAPKYPPIAAAAHVSGAVRVEVLLDSAGQVTSASALDGHALLRKISETAAKDWRFDSAGDVAVRKVHLIFSFFLFAADCKKDVINLAPEYLLSYMVNVRRRRQCPSY